MQFALWIDGRNLVIHMNARCLQKIPDGNGVVLAATTLPVIEGKRRWPRFT